MKIDLFVEDLPAEESVKQLIDKLTQFLDSNGIDYTQKGPDYNNFYALIIGWAESDDFLGIPKKNDYYALLYKGLKSSPELNEIWQQFWSSHQVLLELYLEYLEIYKQLESMRDVLWDMKLNDRAPTDVVDQYVNEKCAWFTSRSRELFRLSRHLEGLIIVGLNELGMDTDPNYIKILRG